MPNRSHKNSAHYTLNQQKRDGRKHSSHRAASIPECTHHLVVACDALELLRRLPDSSVQLVVCDPPYNIHVAEWDSYSNYLDWAKEWLEETYRVLTPTGSFVLFGGFQYQDEEDGGDLLDLAYYLRHHTDFRLVNVIIWHYKNGMGAHRFFANRHEEILWYSKTRRYTFNLDAVRIPYDEATRRAYLKDPRLNPETVNKGKNPTNVWEIGRLNGNSKERVGHPTQKPAALISRIIKALSLPGDTVIDFFAGSGTTSRVCIETARHSISSDVNPEIHQYFARHLEQLTEPPKSSSMQRLVPWRIHHDIIELPQHPVIGLGSTITKQILP